MEHIKTIQEFEKLIKDNSKVVIDFYASWCGPCKMLSPIIEEAETNHPEVKFVKVDVDEAEELASMFGITSIPLVCYIKDGQLVNRELGFKPKEVVETNINELK